jgi:hypothetical protein
MSAIAPKMRTVHRLPLTADLVVRPRRPAEQGAWLGKAHYPLLTVVLGLPVLPEDEAVRLTVLAVPAFRLVSHPRCIPVGSHP